MSEREQAVIDAARKVVETRRNIERPAGAITEAIGELAAALAELDDKSKSELK